jgi:hypothetical protein
MSTEFPDERLELLFVCAHPAVDSATHKPFMLQITDPRQGNWVRARHGAIYAAVGIGWDRTPAATAEKGCGVRCLRSGYRTRRRPCGARVPPAKTTLIFSFALVEIAPPQPSPI